MNLTHLRYMVEVERLGSITKKAASALYMGQPNLSKSYKGNGKRSWHTDFLKEVQRVLLPQKRVRQFLQYAKAILVQMDKMESLL